MAASIKNTIIRGVTISVGSGDVEATEWWGEYGELGQSGEYNTYSGSFSSEPPPPWIIYKRLVTRDSNGAGSVVSEMADTNSSSPSVSWTPTTTSSSPSVVAYNLPNGEWEIDLTGVASDGGILVISGSGTQELTITITQDSMPQFVATWVQSGSR